MQMVEVREMGRVEGYGPWRGYKGQLGWLCYVALTPTRLDAGRFVRASHNNSGMGITWSRCPPRLTWRRATALGS
eukprot:356566-Chlamydomonas_euryale.AAC.1